MRTMVVFYQTIHILDKPDSSRVLEAFEDYHNVLELHSQDAESVEHMVDIAIHGNNRDILVCLTQIDMVLSNLKANVKNFDIGNDANSIEWITGNGWTIEVLKDSDGRGYSPHLLSTRTIVCILGSRKRSQGRPSIAAMLDSEHPQVFLSRCSVAS